MLRLLVLICIAYFTATAIGGKPFQAKKPDLKEEDQSKRDAFKDFDSKITIADTPYNEWPELRSLLEGIGLGYLMLADVKIDNSDTIIYGEKTIGYKFEKPISVAFLGQGGNGMNGLISFLIRLVKGKEQIIFYVVRDETSDERKEALALEIANALFKTVTVTERMDTFGCTKKQFITTVIKLIDDPAAVTGEPLFSAIKNEYQKIDQQELIVSVINARNKRETNAKIILDQFTDLLKSVEDELGVRVIRQPNLEVGVQVQKYNDDIVFLRKFKNIRLIGDDLAGRGRVGDAIKVKAHEPLILMKSLSEQVNTGDKASPPIVWAADAQSFGNTLLPDGKFMEDGEAERLNKDMTLLVPPKRTSVTGVFTGNEKEGDFKEHEYSICQTGNISDFIERIDQANLTYTGLAKYRYAVPRADTKKSWKGIYNRDRFPEFIKAISLEGGGITVEIGEVIDGQIDATKQETFGG